MPCAESSTICARRQVTTDPLPRRTIRTSRRPSSSSISRTRSRSVTGPVSTITNPGKSPRPGQRRTCWPPGVSGRVYRRGMVFWQLTIDANDPAALARFWAQALGYQPAPPAEPATTWHALYHARLGEDAAYDDRLFDPDGLRPPIWFQQV